jgi:hypothetical protein
MCIRDRMYPNPVPSNLTIEGDIKNILLTDINGNTMLKSKNKTIDMNSLNSGTYILYITQKNNEVMYEKIIKL